MLTDLPQELLLAILSYLHLPHIALLRSLCTSWNQFILSNSNPIYRAAAVLDLNIPPSIESVHALTPLYYSPRSLFGVHNWEAFCIRVHEINESWKGNNNPSTITLHQFTGDSAVHRFKIDEEVGLIIATTTHGGIVVTDLDASKWYDRRTNARRQRTCRASSEDVVVLWSIPMWRVRSYAHCEYERGYLIFDRSESKEIWRLAQYDYYYPNEDGSTPSAPAVVPAAVTDEWQRTVSSSAAQEPPKKGHFVPWALLTPPSRTRAFRFVYPYLLVASFRSAYLYDVRTGVMVQEISDIQGLLPDEHGVITGPLLNELNYVEHCPHYVFICGETCLRIFSRRTGRRVYDIPAVHDNYGISRWTLSPHRYDHNMSLDSIIGGDVDDDPLKAWEKAGSVLYQHHLLREEDRTEKFMDQIVATHVSPCGNYLVVMLETSRLLLIRDLHKVIQGEISLLDSTIEVQLGRASRFSKYLAFENGRVGVATRNGIFIVIPHPSFFSSDPLTLSSPPPTVLRVHVLNDPIALSSISCLQMTRTGLFVNWTPSCPFARHSLARSARYRRNTHATQDDMFWYGLETPPQVGRELSPLSALKHPLINNLLKDQETGHAFIVEEVMLPEPLESVVLSVDFVPT